jgi:hypothetical protein
VESHLSNLTEQEVNKIIKYFKKKRILFWFKKYFSVFIVLIFIVVFIVINSQTPASGEINGSVNAQGELTLDWSFESPVEEGVILVESESELLIIEIDDSNGTVTECCFQEDLAILLLFTDDEDDIVEVESVNITLPNTDISSKTTSILETTSTLTSTTIAECNDDEFVPYTLYDSEGNANTVLTCRNEQDALDSGYIYTTNPKPVTTSTTLAPTTTSTTLAPTTTSTTLAPTTTSTTLAPTTTSTTLAPTTTSTTLAPTTTSTTLAPTTTSTTLAPTTTSTTLAPTTTSTTLAPTTTSTTLAPTTTLATPTVSLLINQIPKSDKLVESSSLQKN